MLVPTKADPATKKRSGNEFLIGTSGTNDSKIILILLAEVVALYMRFIIEKVWEPGFEQILLKVWFQVTYLYLEKQIYTKFCDSLEVFLSILGGSQSRD